ncbi:MAG: DinB family protein [Anaerolineales bacterium]|nr:DinB family protein [Anaerolineales bacterium]NUQ84619.1 DinB family protein [Anaerolineales bacterium]
MKFRVGIENNNEGIRSIAWMLEHPGCYAYGNNEQEAIANSSNAIREYAGWVNQHEPSWIPLDEAYEVHVEQVCADYQINEEYDRVEKDGYNVDPFFEHDWKPLTATDIERGLKLLAWSRSDLLAVLEALTPEEWKYKKEGERWDVAGIVNHIGGAEWWYLDRLGLAFPRGEVPKEPMERLEKVRRLMNEQLPAFAGSKQAVGVDGEFWSPRKVLRRALWHERDHTDHIGKLLSQN